MLHKYFELFAKRGYLDVTMREIARELGVSTGTLYHYFPTKQSIMEQLFRIASRRDSSEYLSYVDENADIKTRITQSMQYVNEKEVYFQDIVLLTIDYLRYHDSHEAFQVMREADSYYGNAIAKALGMDEKYGFFVAIFLNGLVYHRLVFPDSVTFEEQAELFVNMFTSYIKLKNEPK